MTRILMIVGSIRRDSFNRQLAREIEGLLGARAEVSYLDYAALPYMNQDIEFPAPAEVAQVRAAVQAADGIWICTPEYNSGIPGVLKNLLDWLSRPLVANDPERVSALRGKRVTISGAAGRSAAAGVRGSLAKLLEFMQMRLIGGEGVGVSVNPEAFAGGPLRFTPEQIAALRVQAEAFLEALES